MFDIGFWELAVIAVVALLVVGPNEFPTLVRNISVWIGKARRFMAETKDDLEREFTKAEELKQMIEREASLAELHEKIDARKIVTDMVNGPMGSKVKVSKKQESAALTVAVTATTPVADSEAQTPSTKTDPSHGTKD